MLQERKEARQNPVLEKIEAEQIRVPGQFEIGDTARVHNKIRGGNRERVQMFEGVVVKIQNDGLRKTFTARKISNNIGVEKTWPFSSPFVNQMDVIRRDEVRRAKLSYLRKLSGKAAKVKEVI